MTEIGLFFREVRPALTVAGYWQAKNWIARIGSALPPEVKSQLRFRRVERWEDFASSELVPPSSAAVIECPLPETGYGEVLRVVTELVGRRVHVLIGNSREEGDWLDGLRVAGAMCFDYDYHGFRRLIRAIETISALQTGKMVRWDTEIRQRLPWSD